LRSFHADSTLPGLFSPILLQIEPNMSNKHKGIWFAVSLLGAVIVVGGVLYRERLVDWWAPRQHPPQERAEPSAAGTIHEFKHPSMVTVPIPEYTVKVGKVPAPAAPPVDREEARVKAPAPETPPGGQEQPKAPQPPAPVEILPPQPLPAVPEKASQPERRQAFGLYQSLDFIVRRDEPFEVRGRKLTIAELEAHLGAALPQVAAGAANCVQAKPALAERQAGASGIRKAGGRSAAKRLQGRAPKQSGQPTGLAPAGSVPAARGPVAGDSGPEKDVLEGLVREVQQQLESALHATAVKRQEALRKAYDSADLLASNLRQQVCAPAAPQAAAPGVASAADATEAAGPSSPPNPEQAGPTYYGIRLVRPGENIWEIHYAVIREYFARRNLILPPAADERYPNGRSSGLARLLKFIEPLVSVYDLDNNCRQSNLNLIYPYHALVFFNISELFATLDQVQPEDLKELHFLSDRLWLKQRGEHRYLLDPSQPLPE